MNDDQLSLWGGPTWEIAVTRPRPARDPLARRTDPDTSHDAAVIAFPKMGELREACLTALRAAGPRGLTDFELADALAAAQVICAGPTSCGKRRLELERLGLAEPVIGVDGPLRRLSWSGTPAGVHRAVVA